MDACRWSPIEVEVVGVENYCAENTIVVLPHYGFLAVNSEFGIGAVAARDHKP